MSALELPELRELVWRANQALVRSGLVTLSFGNASGVDRAAGVLLIKPSGVPYDQLRPEQLVAVSLVDGRVVEGDLRPSSDTPTHLLLYQRYPEIGGVVHTHSTAATAWAQAGRPIPPLGTTHADHFHGAVPVTRQMLESEVAGEYERETGAVIIETLERQGLGAAEMPAVLVASHGPFTWGPDAQAAADNATALEAVAAMAIRTFALNPEVEPIAGYLLERHFRRKHGPDAYYGQGPARGAGRQARSGEAGRGPR
ncbi:MAG: L-ribulose-5-phosphate 4-epimerase AraD [Candidatus Limnocylindrales bacterium]